MRRCGLLFLLSIGIAFSANAAAGSAVVGEAQPIAAAACSELSGQVGLQETTVDSEGTSVTSVSWNVRVEVCPDLPPASEVRVVEAPATGTRTTPRGNCTVESGTSLPIWNPNQVPKPTLRLPYALVCPPATTQQRISPGFVVLSRDATQRITKIDFNHTFTDGPEFTSSSSGELVSVSPPPPPPPPPAACGNTLLQLDKATVEGTLAETGPGTGLFRAGPGDVVYVGGFELRPRFGGALVVDTGAVQLREEGAGVEVVFESFAVPLAVSSIPVRVPQATIAFNKDGTLLKSLFSLPVSGSAKVAWSAGGTSTTFEMDLEAEKLVGSFGTFQTGGQGAVQAPSLKLQAELANCTGFKLTGAEIRADEISFIPTSMKVPRKLGLKNFLFKFERRSGKSFWTSQGELLLPVGKGEFAVGGKLSIADSKLAGVGLSASGINARGPYGLFLQRVEGELAFEPSFGANFGVEATLGPVVKGKKLVKLTGNLKVLALATDCTRGQDPIALVATGNIPLVEDFGLAQVKIEGVTCFYATSLAAEQSGKVDATFGAVAGGQIPNPIAALKGNISGFVGEAGLSLDGGGTITLPVIGDVGAQILLSTKAIAGCAQVSFFSGGVAHEWDATSTQTFTGCDLSPWRPGNVTFGLSPASNGHSRAVHSADVVVRQGLPFVGLYAQGRTSAPALRIKGPKGEDISAPSSRAIVGRNLVVVPVAAERRTYVFLRDPSPGRWRIAAAGTQNLRAVASSAGLPDAQVAGEVSGAPPSFTLSYRVRPIAGQQVDFYERTDDGIAQLVGRARGAAGQIAFKPESTGQQARIEAIVIQNGLPRDTITVARFVADKAQSAARCVVPNVRGKTLAAAGKAIRKGRCTVGKVRRSYSGKVTIGRVISQRPKPGARLARGAKVNLVLSRGKRRK